MSEINYEAVIPGTIGLILFGGIAVYFIPLIWLGNRSRTWPVTQGTITRSQLRFGEMVRAGEVTPVEGHQYIPDIAYEYTVDGDRRTGRTVCFGRSWNTNRHQAHKTLAAYPVGRSVEVRYHPERPDFSTLEPRAEGRVPVFAVMAAAMCGTILYGVMTEGGLLR